MLLLFWSARPVEVELDAAGTSDAEFTAGLRQPVYFDAHGTATTDETSLSVGTLIAPLDEPLTSAGEALTGLEYILQIPPFQRPPGVSDDLPGEAEGEGSEFRVWRRVAITIDALHSDVRPEVLEP